MKITHTPMCCPLKVGIAMDPSFLEVFGIIFTVVCAIGSGFALWAASETADNRQARHGRYQQQDWVSTQFQRRQRAETAYRQNAYAKIDASRRSHATKAA